MHPRTAAPPRTTDERGVRSTVPCTSKGAPEGTLEGVKVGSPSPGAPRGPCAKAPGEDCAPAGENHGARPVGSRAKSASTGVTSAMEVPPSERKEAAKMEEPYRYFVGIDWATEKHQVCVLDVQGSVVVEKEVVHRREALHALFEELASLVDGRPEKVAVGIETPRGALVESLVERGFHVYALNPKQMDRFRDRHTVPGAKDDRLDSLVIGDSLRTDRQLYRRVRVDDPLIVQIRELSRASDDLKVELGRLCNLMREQVYRFMPQLLPLSPAADEPWLWDLLDLLSGGSDPRRVRPTQVERILKVNRIRRLTTEDVVTVLREQAPWTTPGTREAVCAHMALLLPRLRVALEQDRQCDKQIELLLDELAAYDPPSGERREHRDVQILQSLPGAGNMVVATMLAEASQPLADRNYHVLRAHGGIAPVTKSSGKRSKSRATVTMRYGCNDRLKNAFFYWAKGATQYDPLSKAHYSALRGRGHSHGRALRGVADRLLSVLVAMLEDCTLYDPSRRRANRLSPVST
jgi:transposase